MWQSKPLKYGKGDNIRIWKKREKHILHFPHNHTFVSSIYSLLLKYKKEKCLCEYYLSSE
jgi:hypothetical protein